MVVAAAATSILSLYGSQAFADSNADGVAADSPGVLSGNSVGAPVDVPVNACGNSANVVAGLNPAFGNSCATPTGKHRKPDTSGRGHEAPAGHASDHRHASDHGRGHGSDHGDGSGHRGPGDRGSGHHGSGHQGSGHHGSGHHGSGHRDSGPHGPGHHDPGHRGSGHHGGGSAAHGETHGSPGVGAGNAAAVPVGVPVNACGNSVDVIGLLNPTFGNKCAHHDGPRAHGDAETPPAGHPSTPPAQPPTAATPPSAPPTTGPSMTEPPTRRSPGTRSPVTTLPATTLPSTAHAAEGIRPQLAHTGSDGMLAASAAGVGLLLGGAVLYRRNRAASRRW
jgi:LPXTG-motif cell wall-anchored protein